jgi:hypothetical protein
MVTLSVHKDFQAVRYLRFFYLCGRDFVEDDEVDGDHVPPSARSTPATATPFSNCHLPDRATPDGATRDGRYRVVVPNEDPLDAFSR